MKLKGIVTLILLYLLLFPVSGFAKKCMEHDHDHGEATSQVDESHEKNNHDGHDDHIEANSGHEDHEDAHGGHEDHEDAHGGHEDHEDAHSSHEGHEDESVLILTDKAKGFVGLQTSVADRKTIEKTIELPGEIVFNQDRMVKIAPRYPGIVKKVTRRLGESINKGDLLAVVESNESLTNYSILSPISGKVVEKYIVPGEFVGEDASLFVIADLSTVWVNCDVFAKDADFVKEGRSIEISAVGTDKKVCTVLSYVAPVYNTVTRSMIARAVIENTDGNWRPGTFITGTISALAEKPVLAVLQTAVQVLQGETVVFVPSEKENGFEPNVIQTGKENNQYVEILSGLAENDIYVSEGAFELKAEIVTSSLGGHAGHGH